MSTNKTSNSVYVKDLQDYFKHFHKIEEVEKIIEKISGLENATELLATVVAFTGLNEARIMCADKFFAIRSKDSIEFLKAMKNDLAPEVSSYVNKLLGDKPGE